MNPIFIWIITIFIIFKSDSFTYIIRRLTWLCFFIPFSRGRLTTIIKRIYRFLLALFKTFSYTSDQTPLFFVWYRWFRFVKLLDIKLQIQSRDLHLRPRYSSKHIFLTCIKIHIILTVSKLLANRFGSHLLSTTLFFWCDSF